MKIGQIGFLIAVLLGGYVSGTVHASESVVKTSGKSEQVADASVSKFHAVMISSRPASAPTLKVHSPGAIQKSIKEKGVARIIVRLTPPAELSTGFADDGGISSKVKQDKQRNAIRRQQDIVASKLSALRSKSSKKFKYIPFSAFEVDSSELQAIAALPEVDMIQEDVAFPPLLAQSVPLIGGTNGTFTTSAYSGSGQTVAILDTGVEKGQPFLTGKVVAEGCFSTTNSTSTAYCTSGSTAAGSGVPCSDTTKGCYHGTHVAGIVAGKNGSAEAPSGVARDASLIAIQVFSQFPASYQSCNGSTCPLSYSSDQISAMEYVYSLRSTYNIAAINMSLGGGGYTDNCDSSNLPLKAAIDNLRSVGIATVIASGNSSYTNMISAPACISTAISVGATDKSDNVASYSNSASILHLLAPGSSINSSLLSGTYGPLNGTSMATPHVAGSWAVMKSAKPGATVEEISAALQATGVNITDSRNSIIKPRVKLDDAVTYLVTLPRYTLIVEKSGGTGTVKSSPLGISCGSTCSAQFYEQVPVTLVANTGVSSTFTGWSGGGCSGAGNCIVRLAADTTVTANFKPVYKLLPSTETFDSVTVPLLPEGWWTSDSSLGRWYTNIGTRYPSGVTAHSGTQLVYFNSFNVASGDSAMLISPQFALAGVTGGKVSFWVYRDAQSYTDSGVTNDDRVEVYINSTPDISGATLLGTVNRLTTLSPAVSAAGWYNYEFTLPANYNGDANYIIMNGISGYGNDLHLDDIAITGVVPQYRLNVGHSGTGGGTVYSDSGVVSCASGSCSYDLTNATILTLKGTSSSDSSFTGWSGDCSGSGDCIIKMSAARNVNGVFELIPKARIGTIPYSTLANAYAAVIGGGVIQAQVLTFAENLALNRAVSFKLQGGYAEGYGSRNGYTTLDGNLIIGNGCMVIDRLIIK